MSKSHKLGKSLKAISRELGLTLHEQVRRRLRELVEVSFKDGDRFFSERELIEQLHVSQPTVRRALTDLAAEGLLDRGVGKGTFVRKSAKDRSVGVFVPKIDAFLQLSIVSTLGMLCAERDFGFHLYHLQPNRSVQQSCEALRRSPRDERIVFNGTIADDTWELFEELEKRGYRSVYIGQGEGYPGNMVSTDHQLGAELAFKHLISLGHEHIAFVVNEPTTLESIRIRLEAIRHLIERESLKHITIVDCNLERWGRLVCRRVREDARGDEHFAAPNGNLPAVRQRLLGGVALSQQARDQGAGRNLALQLRRFPLQPANLSLPDVALHQPGSGGNRPEYSLGRPDPPAPGNGFTAPRCPGKHGASPPVLGTSFVGAARRGPRRSSMLIIIAYERARV